MANSQQDAAVIFNRTTLGVDVTPDRYLVPNGDTLILTLNLMTVGTGTGDAVYPPSPSQAVLFKDGKPPGIQVTRDDDTTLTVTEKNQNPKQDPAEFSFRVQVLFQNQLFPTPDPTIVNLGQAPGEPGGKDGKTKKSKLEKEKKQGKKAKKKA